MDIGKEGQEEKVSPTTDDKGYDKSREANIPSLLGKQH